MTCFSPLWAGSWLEEGWKEAFLTYPQVLTVASDPQPKSGCTFEMFTQCKGCHHKMAAMACVGGITKWLPW